MRSEIHVLSSRSAGSRKELTSLHFGLNQNRKKVYIQSSLHADEIPGMLVSFYLKQRLEKLESQGAIEGTVVLVPVANPIGLSQDIQGTAFGRFDLASGLNFNRGYQHLTPEILNRIGEQLSLDVEFNRQLIRRTAAEILDELQTIDETAHLKKTLQRLAIDADIVLDLHCDNQAVMHLYTGAPLAERGLPLAAFLQAHALLVSKLPGDDPFDDSCSRHWWELQDHFGETKTIPLACQSLTVELRGETDVSHETAKQDADAIIAYLQHEGHIQTDPNKRFVTPPAICVATPLEGVEPIVAPYGGIVVFTKELGSMVQAGDSIADLIDPISGQLTPLRASVSGVLFARVARRYVHAGARIAKIAGQVAYRTGNLLSA
ncbi:succinylglutamate desuccinylase/aspartoacylase family protein [Undibacterium sp. LX40W]|uniref:Succinylglutamate desuccinylase/aspartoacylase family protein n=1 Tax=Undibacterium nitidum TaxID=2762298 RepID=A0A923KPW7_9BURK|nr:MULTISPECIES: succinylglutamate desuccinylase/aspartoacylase family protein [Undibacterium]MBC3882273.1 succinylglutamate desuccinylase/aspartoacylase family protein [Undibacterium nitidum]MBC3892554.1 succinylglutamate desuccinylase/aspartoacylase family protein [Undibacterium sp. LX40W]